MSEVIELSSNEESMDGLQQTLNTLDLSGSTASLNASQSESNANTKSVNSGQSRPTTKSSGKVGRKSFTLFTKLSAIKWYKANGFNKKKTAIKFKTLRQNIQHWVGMEDQLLKDLKDRNVKVKEKRRLSYIGKPLFPEVDRRVKEWFVTQRSDGLSVNSDSLVATALEEFGKCKAAPGMIGAFKASSGWLKNFLKRERLGSRTVTSNGQKIPINAKEITQLFFNRVDAFRAQQTDNNFSILNMDQTPMYFDSPTHKTYDSIGAKTVTVKTTGYEKIRFTLMVCATHDGRKCPPVIIFKGLKKVPKKEKFPNGIHIMVNKSGSINHELLDDWRKNVYSRRPGGLFLNKHIKRSNGPKHRSLLVIDAATPHRNKDFKKFMANFNDTKVEIIPGGMTPLLQPADVSWNRSLKASIRRMWSEWMAKPKGPEDRTKAGALKRPSYALIAEWCLQAWKDLPQNQIIESFKFCNLHSKRDDSALHSKLKTMLNSCPVGNSEENEPSGLTDTESDGEESEEVIDYIEESNEQTNEDMDGWEIFAQITEDDMNSDI